MQRYERLWERLLTLLGTLGEVDASTPGRLRLRIDRQRVEIVMTEGEWDDLVSIPWGSFSGGAQHLLNALSAAEAAGAPYLVYDRYDLLPSETPESPMRLEEEAEHRRVMDHLRANPGVRGAWFAHPPDRGTDQS
jgi:hypothetical protein